MSVSDHFIYKLIQPGSTCLKLLVIFLTIKQKYLLLLGILIYRCR